MAGWRSDSAAAAREPASTGATAIGATSCVADIISMPDKWEYPWFAAWDLAFHCVTLSLIDPDFAKHQLLLLCEVSLMHPNGELPAYEWAFGDVNPPVHAWAAMRVFENDRNQRGGTGDLDFLERIFHKLLLNFTWWVNRKDPQGLNIFEGGFLGLDNIGVFDRSRPLPTGGYIEQSDGTAWMAMFCLNMLRIAIELSQRDPVYEDMAIKFLEHFLYIARAMTDMGKQGIGLWDDADNFFYSVLYMPSGHKIPMRLRSMVGLIPLFAVAVMEQEVIDKLPELRGTIERYARAAARFSGARLTLEREGPEGTSPICHSARFPHDENFATPARRDGVPLAVRRQSPIPLPSREPLRFRVQRRALWGEVSSGRV